MQSGEKSGEQRGQQVGNGLQKRNNSVSPFKFYIFLTSFFEFFISKLSSLSHGILVHHQFPMLLTFIFLFVDKFYIYIYIY